MYFQGQIFGSDRIGKHKLLQLNGFLCIDCGSVHPLRTDCGPCLKPCELLPRSLKLSLTHLRCVLLSSFCVKDERRVEIFVLSRN